ncbi:hypothetical protein BJV78DRAFT_1136794, partial [Lactifluus subvellereus]
PLPSFRTTPHQRPGKLRCTHMLEGRCHRCARWIPVQGVKDTNAKINGVPRWKHVATCHSMSTIPGKHNVFILDPTN